MNYLGNPNLGSRPDEALGAVLALGRGRRFQRGNGTGGVVALAVVAVDGSGVGASSVAALAVTEPAGVSADCSFALGSGVAAGVSSLNDWVANHTSPTAAAPAKR
jgi:hypothetical protein